MKMPRPKRPVPEIPVLKHSFFAGSHYENMKGAYEVLSVEGNTMRIRWENGEESETDVELQDRILSRFEREVRAAGAGPGNRQAPDEDEPHRAPQSRGLVASDFSQDVSTTTWRSRTGGIGGLVSDQLKLPELCVGFWVPFRESTILWADVGQKTRSAAEVQAGFLCRLDAAQVCYGFFVRRPKDEGEGSWYRLLEWLNVPGHEERLRSVIERNGLRIFDGPSASASAFLHVRGGQWERVEDGQGTRVPSLSAFLDSAGQEPGALLECVTVIPKDVAVGRGRKIGRDLAQLFEALTPVYRVCLGLPEEPAPSGAARKRPKA
jgi:hypothetical protein